MANILNLITVGQKLIYEVDAPPASGSGTAGTVGDLAFYDNGSGSGTAYIKVGSANTAWDLITTQQSNTNVNQGSILQIPVYDQTSGWHLNPTVLQNGYTLGMQFVAMPTRAANIVFTIPNPGDSITSTNFILDQGNQTINGNMTFSQNVTVNGNLTVNGSMTSINTTTTNVTDPFITLNNGGAAGSGSDVGLHVQENSAITGYLTTSSDRLGWDLKAPATGASGYPAATGVATLRTPAANQIFQLPNASGTVVIQANPTAAVAAQISFWANGTTLTNEVGSGAAAFTWNVTNHWLGIQQVTPQTILHVGNYTTSGTVGTNAIILGQLNNAANVGQGALIANGSGGSNTASGQDSTALGSSNVASATSAFVVGTGNTASGNQAIVGGKNSTASATGALVFGQNSTASGAGSCLIGSYIADGGNTGVLMLADNQAYTTTADTATQLKMRFANGLKLVMGGGANNVDGPNYQIIQASTSTTNATVTTIQTIAIPNNSSVLITTNVIGRRTGGTAGNAMDAANYIRTARLKNNGGTVTMYNLQADYTSEDQTTWNCTIAVSGTSAIIQVTGAANNNIAWFATTMVQVNS